MIYFIETYTGKKVPYNVVHRANQFRWKDLYHKSSLRIAYEGEESGEDYEMYVDFVDLLFWYQSKGK